jgi:hypothetical protein
MLFEVNKSIGFYFNQKKALDLDLIYIAKQTNLAESWLKVR